jgi:translocation and assembly module TamB
VAYRPDPLSVGLPPNATFSGQVDGTVDLSRALVLAQLDQPVSGRATLALRLAGTVGQPQLDGSAELVGGRYANPALGVTLDALNAKLIGRGSRLELASLSASDGGKGSLSGQGAIDFSAAKPAFDGSVQLSSFAIQRDDATAVANAALRFGGGADGGQVSGKVTIDQANITLPDQLPPAIVKIDVVEINGSRTATITPGPTKPQRESTLPVALSLTIDLPGRIFVRGRGLDSEWRGRLAIQGTADKPSIQGTLSLVRGRLALLGRTLTLSDGQINFPGGATLDPILDITATATTTNLTATIKITGRASQPTLTITSDPPMPQDEILAEVLFNKQVTQLSAAEALQLAQGVATLTMGGGGGIVDQIRKATGLDVIDVQSGDSTTGASGSALSVGKYLSDRVFVTATQGLSAASSRAGVEIYLTKQLTVKTDAGAAADSTLGLNWKLDY